MPSEKHLKRAREMSWSGVDGRVNVIASALEAVERETAERCAEIAGNPYTDEVSAFRFNAPSEVGGKIAAAILKEFGIAEKEQRA